MNIPPTASQTRVAGKERFHEIDVFRGIASLWVVYYHYFFHYRVAYHVSGTPLGWFAVDGLPEKDIGRLPVFWFFMISGFVIVWTLENCRTWKDFAVSRFSRLYPTYWAACTLTFAVGLAAPLSDQLIYSPFNFIINLTMLQDVLGVPPVDGVYWSLTVELLFYILMGSIFAFGLMNKLHEICFIWIGVCILDYGLALAGIDMWYRVQKYGLLYQGHFLVAGIMFYEIWRGRRVVLSHLILAMSLVSIFLAYPHLVALLCFGCMSAFYLAIRGKLRFLVNRPLIWLGSISYALYLCHQMLGYRIIASAQSYWGWRLEPAMLLALTVALALACALTYFVERPAMVVIRDAWRRRPVPSVA